MSNTTTYKLVRMSVMIALVAGSAVACHYQAEDQYVNDKDVPGADSGSRRVSTTTMRSDSTNMPTDAVTASGAAAGTIPSGVAAPVTKPAASAAASNNSSTTSKTKPVTRAKFARGHASVTMPKIYSAADVAPQFPGGERGLDNYITKNVNYPQQAIDDDVSGTVHVSFIVDENGHVTKARVVDAARISDGLDQEALRIVKDMPAWMPGTVKGKKVKTRMELPISFQVES